MARDVSLILLAATGALLAASLSWPALDGLAVVLQVAAERILDGDPGGALEALLAI